MKHHLVPAALLLIAHLLQPTSAPAQAITGGETHALALCSDGTARAWGTGGSGELGNGSNTDSTVPAQVSTLTGIKAIEGGGASYSIALKNDGTVWSWGYNYAGQFGNGTNTPSLVPVQASIAGVTAIAAGYAHTLALKPDSTVWAWGLNLFGQLGNGTYTDTNVSVQVIGLCSISTGLARIADAPSVEVFPNPTTGRSTIQGTIAGAQLEIQDALGQEIQRSQLRGSSSEIDLS